MKQLIPPYLRVTKRAMQSWVSGEPELRLIRRLCSQNEYSIDVGANHGVWKPDFWWRGALRSLDERPTAAIQSDDRELSEGYIKNFIFIARPGVAIALMNSS